jgi:formate dehydrogenase assembly factor FdhD
MPAPSPASRRASAAGTARASSVVSDDVSRLSPEPVVMLTELVPATTTSGLVNHRGGRGHSDHDGMGNIADVSLAPGVMVAPGARRNFMTTSACGVCGKASIEDICVLPDRALAADPARFAPSVLATLPERLREAQRVFSRTGGLHAAGLFTGDGELIIVREDVGRHNAVDKVVGWALLNGRLPLSGCILLVSGPASFELVQKAVLAGIPLLAAFPRRPRWPSTWPRRRGSPWSASCARRP